MSTLLNHQNDFLANSGVQVNQFIDLLALMRMKEKEGTLSRFIVPNPGVDMLFRVLALCYARICPDSDPWLSVPSWFMGFSDKHLYASFQYGTDTLQYI